jgi:hypothetical protein
MAHFNESTNFQATDVQGFLQAGKLRFIMVVYKEFDKALVVAPADEKVVRAKFKLYRDPSSTAPKVTAEPGKQCGTKYIDGC